jgi:cellulose synthase/poly-beta-1,6-N-acetylglucosamine synthase-like glycosyltransferase
VSEKVIYDIVGCMLVIPGPCGLYRYRALGSLKEGVMKRYFDILQGSIHNLVAGNLRLVEDRILCLLLVFPQMECHVSEYMPKEGWPRTGFVHNAIFYLEAEKPMSQLVKQRRRWLNGMFATYLWMLCEFRFGVSSRSNKFLCS